MWMRNANIMPCILWLIIYLWKVYHVSFDSKPRKIGLKSFCANKTNERTKQRSKGSEEDRDSKMWKWKCHNGDEKVYATSWQILPHIYVVCCVLLISRSCKEKHKTSGERRRKHTQDKVEWWWCWWRCWWWWQEVFHRIKQQQVYTNTNRNRNRNIQSLI